MARDAMCSHRSPLLCLHSLALLLLAGTGCVCMHHTARLPSKLIGSANITNNKNSRIQSRSCGADQNRCLAQRVKFPSDSAPVFALRACYQLICCGYRVRATICS